MEVLLPMEKAIHDFRLVHGAISFYLLIEEVSNKFQSTAVSEIVHETLIKEDLNIILKVQETASQISTNEDDLSMVTMDSSNGGSVENHANAAENIEVVKKKRTYKPRKKKETA